MQISNVVWKLPRGAFYLLAYLKFAFPKYWSVYLFISVLGVMLQTIERAHNSNTANLISVYGQVHLLSASRICLSMGLSLLAAKLIEA